MTIPAGRPIPPPPHRRFFAGLDLGCASDFTALCILERQTVSRTTPPDGELPVYVMRHCRRYPLGTSYPTIVDDVAKRMKNPAVQGVALAVDKTGVGAAVVHLFRKVGHPIAVSITAGSQASFDGDEWRIPKRELVTCLQLLFQNGRLRIPAFPGRDVLVAELQAFRVKVSADTGAESFEAWRSRDHDDEVLALALAAYVGEQALAAEVDAARARPRVTRVSAR